MVRSFSRFSYFFLFSLFFSEKMDTDEVLDGCSGAISSREVSTAHGSKKLRLEDGSATTTSVSSDGALSLKKEGEGEGKGGDAGGQSEEKKARPAEVECSDIAGGTPLGLTHHPKEPRSVEPHATKSCATTGVCTKHGERKDLPTPPPAFLSSLARPLPPFAPGFNRAAHALAVQPSNHG